LLLLFVIALARDSAGPTVGGILRYVSVTEHFGDMQGRCVRTSNRAIMLAK